MSNQETPKTTLESLSNLNGTTGPTLCRSSDITIDGGDNELASSKENTRNLKSLTKEIKKELEKESKRSEIIKLEVGGAIFGSILLWLMPSFFTGMMATGCFVTTIKYGSTQQYMKAFFIALKTVATIGVGVASVYYWDLALPRTAFFAGMGAIVGINFATALD